MGWFDDGDQRAERLAGVIFDLRRHLFLKTVHRPAPEREWETEEQETARERRNDEALMQWDLETRKLILDCNILASTSTEPVSQGVVNAINRCPRCGGPAERAYHILFNLNATAVKCQKCGMFLEQRT